MAIFCLEAALIQSIVPFYRRAIAEELRVPNHSVQLDGLRGLLALSVFFTHSITFHYWIVDGKWELPHSQFYSQLAIAPVAMFFLITGFLFWTKAQKGSLGSLRNYFMHRVRRLFPAYLFSVLLIVFVELIVTRFQVRVSLFHVLRSIISYLSFSLIPGPSLTGFDSGRINAGVFWSLRVEWMFYFLLPIFAWFARKNRTQLLLLLLSIASYFVLPFVRAKFPWAKGAGTLQYFEFYFLSYFSIGMVVSFVRIRFRIESFARGRTAAICAGALLLMLFFVPPEAGLLEGAILGFPLLIVVYGNSFFGLLNAKPIVLLGQMSYSTYLLHGIILFVANKSLSRMSGVSLQPSGFWMFTTIVGMTVVALSALSYRYFEAPFIKGFGAVPINPK